MTHDSSNIESDIMRYLINEIQKGPHVRRGNLSIDGNSSLFHDLKFAGDDMDELMSNIGEKYNIDMSIFCNDNYSPNEIDLLSLWFF